MLGSQNTLSTSIWLARAAPAVGPYPETTFKTPGGRPAWQKGWKLQVKPVRNTNTTEIVLPK